MLQLGHRLLQWPLYMCLVILFLARWFNLMHTTAVLLLSECFQVHSPDFLSTWHETHCDPGLVLGNRSTGVNACLRHMLVLFSNRSLIPKYMGLNYPATCYSMACFYIGVKLPHIVTACVKFFSS